MLLPTVSGYYEPQPDVPEKDIIQENVSCGLEGPQPFPGSATSSEADGTVDCTEYFECINTAPDVIRSYSETTDQAYQGGYLEGYGYKGGGSPISDQTLGVSRNGFRGMADEPLPIRPPRSDHDADYDNDGDDY